MGTRHAYLIMAHNDFSMLSEILKALDHERNDIFLHIDAKVGEYPQKMLQDSVVRGRIFQIPRMEVNWGGYSQIACELHLMDQATKAGPHAYYHMMTGATAPLRPADEILSFFDQHAGKEFIGFDNSKDCSSRVRYYNVFNEIGKADCKRKEIQALIRNKFRGVQKKFGYTYGPARNIDFKKGFVYWSLTQDAVNYILSKKDWITRTFKHSFCGDELFAQTIIYNSPFKEKIYNLDNEYDSCLRYVKPVQSWQSGYSGGAVSETQKSDPSICVSDLTAAYESGAMYGWKFIGEEGLRALRELQAR